jgi:hypothetical protein
MPKGRAPSLAQPVNSVALVRNATLTALQVHAIVRELHDAYERHLQLMVFCQPLKDRKAALSFQRTLKASDAYPVLQIIWKESPYVDERELEAVRYARSFAMQPLTCYGLATQIAESPADVAKVNKRLRAIVHASLAYSLIEVKKLGPKKLRLTGSDLLHRFMIELSRTNLHILAGKPALHTVEVSRKC